ncbi:MAG TPA: YCF48-related protein [Bacteroidota bacterium]
MARFLIAVLTSILNCQAKGQDSSSWFWQNPLPQGNALNDVHAFDKNAAVAVGNAGTVIKTTDGGIHWAVQHYAGGVSTRLNAVSFLDANVGTAVGDSGIVIRSIDGGHTWQEWSRIAGALYIRDIWFIDIDTGVVLSGLSIYRTNDSGKSWNQVHSNSLGFLGVAFADESTGVACGQGGIIARTTDAGLTWTDQQIANYYAGLAAIGFANERVGYTVGLLTGSDTTSQGPICHRTTDGGH